MKQLKNRIFISLLAAMGITLGAGLVLFPLLLPTENYFRMAAQLFPMAVIIALLLVFPLHALSVRTAKAISEAKKQAAFSVESTPPTVIDIPTEAAPPPPSLEQKRALPPRPAKPRAPRKPRSKPAARPVVTDTDDSTPEIDIPTEPTPVQTATPARPAKPRAPRKPRVKKAPAETEKNTPAAETEPAGEQQAEEKLPVP